MHGLVRIDGALGEGGGQVVRSAASLSVITGRRFEITGIRANRPNPGLRAQHVAGLRFLAAATGGELEGAEIGSSRVRFDPGLPRAGDFAHDIGTAGSIALFLQTVLPVYLLVRGVTTLTLRGGTDVAHAPPLDWYTAVFIRYVAPLVQRLEVEVLRRGFYPRGGGEVRVRIENPGGPDWELDSLRAHVAARLGAPRVTPGAFRAAAVSSVATETLREAEVAERQADAAGVVLARRLLARPVRSTAYVRAASIGSTLTVWIDDAAGNRIGGNALGARGVRAEAVGHRAAGEALTDMQGGATVDRWMADQVVPWIALGAGAVRIPHLTGHLETNALTCQAFLGAEAVARDGLIVHGALGAAGAASFPPREGSSSRPPASRDQPGPHLPP